MKRTLTLLAFAAAAAATAHAQETYWIANRASLDIMELSPWGSIRDRIDMNTALRSAHVAPDGKVWVVRFIQGTFDIVNPTTRSITPVPAPGNPFDVAFDAQGTAWMTAGTVVANFDANGVLIQTYALAAPAPLGIAIDPAGNKWIAHRTNPASVSKIDPSGTVTNHPLSGAPATFLPVRVAPDFRGLLQPSHIWVVGDGPSHLFELDDNGTTLNMYLPPATALANIAVAPNGNLWLGNTGGTLLEIDRNNGSVLSTFVQSPSSVLGLAFDLGGKLWATQRLTFSGVGPPCEVRRIDPATGSIEVPGVLQYGGYSGIGTQSALSTPYNYALVVAPFADDDGDGEVNFAEVMQATNPRDALSNSKFHAQSTGITRIGNTPTIDVTTPPTTFWMMAFGFGLVAPGSGYTDPTITGEFRLNPALILPVNLSGIGNTSIPFPIPNSPVFTGMEFFMQGFHIGTGGIGFTNITGLLIW
jgi:streptogramin lyase